MRSSHRETGGRKSLMEKLKAPGLSHQGVLLRHLVLRARNCKGTWVSPGLNSQNYTLEVCYK